MSLLRKTVLGGALLATLAASVLDLPGLEGGAADVAEPTTRTNTNTSTTRPGNGNTPVAAAPAQRTTSPSQLPDRVTWQRGALEPAAPNLFATHSWQPPAPPAARAQAPGAPALPFRYIGKSIDDGQVLVFLGQGERTHLVRKGDVLADYRVDDVTTSAMTLVYLPLNEIQRLTFGSAN